MQKFFQKFVLVFIVLAVMLLFIPFVHAQDGLDDGFYNGIYTRISEEAPKQTLENLSFYAGISQEDIQNVLRNQGGETYGQLLSQEAMLQKQQLEDTQKKNISVLGNSLNSLFGTLGEIIRNDDPNRNAYESLRNTYEELIDQLSDAPQTDITLLTQELESLRASLSSSTAPSDVLAVTYLDQIFTGFHQLVRQYQRNISVEVEQNKALSLRDNLANQERLVKRMRFEQQLAELKIELEEQVKLVEVFADGIVDDLGENIPQYDLVNDLSLMDFVIFGKSESQDLSTKFFAGGGSANPSQSTSGSAASTNPQSTVSQSSSQLTSQSSALSSSQPSSTPLAGQNTFGFQNPLTLDNIDPTYEDSQNRDDAVSQIGSQSLQCVDTQTVTLDTTPFENLNSLEYESISSSLTVFPSISQTGAESSSQPSIGVLPPPSSSDLHNPTLDTVLGNYQVSSLPELFSQGNFDAGQCSGIDFDVKFCLELEMGSYNKTRIVKNDNCISCHVAEIKRILEQDLLPYSLRAHKNEGQLGAGGFCTGALSLDALGIHLTVLTKAPKRDREICYEDPLREVRESVSAQLADNVNGDVTIVENIKEAQNNLFLLIQRARTETNGSAIALLQQQIAAIRAEIQALNDQRKMNRNNGFAQLESWRRIQAQYEASTGCDYTVGNESNIASFQKLVDDYNVQLQGVVSASGNTGARSTRDASYFTGTGEFTSTDTLFNAIQDSQTNADNRYNQVRAVNSHIERNALFADSQKYLEREIEEMTAYFISFREALNSLKQAGLFEAFSNKRYE